MSTKPRPTFANACRMYVHRYTMEHVPKWAAGELGRAPGGQYYAPQFRTDQEWYLNTVFPGEAENPHVPDDTEQYCWTTGQTWPLGHWLEAPYATEATR